MILLSKDLNALGPSLAAMVPRFLEFVISQASILCLSFCVKKTEAVSLPRESWAHTGWLLPGPLLPWSRWIFLILPTTHSHYLSEKEALLLALSCQRNWVGRYRYLDTEETWSEVRPNPVTAMALPLSSLLPDACFFPKALPLWLFTLKAAALGPCV